MRTQAKAPYRLGTQRLVLRPYSIADAPELRKKINSKEVSRYTLNIPHPYEEGMAEDFILHTLTQFYENKNFTYALVGKDTGELMGSAGIAPLWRHNKAEIGYWLAEEFWNQGYMTEAVQALIHMGFTALGLNRIFADFLEPNHGSRRVMEKAGMVLESMTRQKYKLGEEYLDAGTCAILKEDYFR